MSYFKSPLISKISDAYRKIFSVTEIESDIALKFFMGSILFSFFVTYNFWILSPIATVESVASGNHLCWPFFQSCGDWIFLSALPYGYSQNMAYMALFGVMVLCCYLMYKRQWTLAHACILILLITRLYFSSINYAAKGNFEYYHTIFTFIFLALPHKRFFLQLTIVMFYFLSTVSKIHPSWILGSYFTSLKTGLPIFPFGTEIIMTNIVVIMEMIFVWFLFSANKIIQRSVFAFFIIFHLYSGLLVSYHYPSIVLPPLLIMFGPWFVPYKNIPLDTKSLFGWALAAFMIVAQLSPKFIEGDEKITLEGNFYGLYMFESNHQCVIHILDQHKNIVDRKQSISARNRCDPYEFWFKAKNKYCNRYQPFGLVMDHSINGGPFYRIVDEPNLCVLTYKPFSHNEWIKYPPFAPAVGRPVQNIYR